MLQATTCGSPRYLAQAPALRPHRTITALVAAVILAVCVAAAVRSDQALDQQLAQLPEPEEQVYAPPATFLKIIALGYERALADLLWFRAISYFGDHYNGDHVYPWLAHMCDRVTDLDPRADHVYRFGGVILPWEANMVDEGIALLEKGARNMPESWDLPYMLGFSYYFFKDDLASASRVLRHAATIPDAPPFVGQLAAVIDAAHVGPDAAIRFLTELDNEMVSPETRDALRRRRHDLMLARDIGALEAAVAAFRARFAHLPVDLSELVRTGILPNLPLEPYGGHYVLDATTGKVASSLGNKPAQLGSSKIRESMLKGTSRGE